MNHKNLSPLCDMAADAHARFQQDIPSVDPIVGVRQNMRENGVPADLMTIDCLRSGKRIIVLLHDQQPDIVSYQFAWRDKDPEEDFKQIAFTELTSDKILELMKSYLLGS